MTTVEAACIIVKLLKDNDLTISGYEGETVRYTCDDGITGYANCYCIIEKPGHESSHTYILNDSMIIVVEENKEAV